jgi:hypothetical protein
MNFLRSILRWLVRHRIIEFLSKLNAYALVSKISIYSIRRLNNNSEYNVICIERPIFDEEIEEISNNSGKVNYVLIPKIIFISIFQSHFHRKKFDHVNYHNNKSLNKEKKAYKKFLENFLDCLLSEVSADAFMSANYVYSWQQELAEICLERDIPFIVLHKEGITSPNQYKNLVQTYTNGKFNASKMLLYNDNIRKALLEADIEGISSKNLVTVGVPRFDKYFNIDKKGRDLVFFSFYMEDKLRHIDISEKIKLELLQKSIDFHIEIMSLAKKRKDINVIIKTKSGEKYLNYVINISKKYGFNGLNNLKVVNIGSPYDLIQDAFLVGGLNSSVLLEAMISRRQIFIPDFKSTYFEDYFINNESLVNYVESAEDIIKCIDTSSNQEHDYEKQKIFLEQYISIPDGKASIRSENEVLSLLEQTR